jgi:uncharacterized protein YeaO (DUF488 family)
VTLKVYTSRMVYAGDDALDVTRSGNDPMGVLFAPSWSLVQPYLNARQAGLETLALWRTYEVNYRREMAESFKTHPARWARLLERESVTLLCFCANADRCHRTVLASILEGMGAQRMGERQLSLF